MRVYEFLMLCVLRYTRLVRMRGHGWRFRFGEAERKEEKIGRSEYRYRYTGQSCVDLSSRDLCKAAQY